MGCRRRILVAAAVFAVEVGTVAAEVPPDFDLRVVSSGLPTRVESAARLSVAVSVANDGALEWSPEAGFALAYHWFDDDGHRVQWDGRRTALGATVAPGGELSLTAEVEVPQVAGRYRFQWDVVHEGVMWISEVDPTPEPRIPVTVIAGHAFAVVEGSAPRFVVAGAELGVQLVLRNDGDKTWLDDGTFALSSHWLDRDGAVLEWEGHRSPVGRPVATGETVELRAVVVTPPRPGFRVLQWDMVEDGVCWFSERQPQPPPGRTVVVVPDVLADPLWWALLSLAAAAAAVSVAARGGPHRMLSVFAVADVLWCAGALVVKQVAVLAAAGAPATGGGLALAAGGAALVALVVLTLPGWWRGLAGWSVTAVATAVLWGDAVYLRFFGDLPGPGAFAAVGQVGQVNESIGSLLQASDLWLCLDLLPGLVLVSVAARLRRAAGANVRRLTAAVLSVVIAVAGAAALRVSAQQPRILDQVFRRLAVARELGVLNLHIVELGAATARAVTASDLEPDRFEAAVDWFAERAPLRAGSGPWFGAAAGCNLVMVQVESLQGFVIGLKIEGREVTPFLNRWARQVLWFDNVTDQTGQGRSSDSELATQVSLLPEAGAAAAFRFADNDFTGLAEVLAGHGYRTVSAVPYDGAFWNRRATHPAYGFARSLFVDDFKTGERVGWGLNDRDFLTQAAGRLLAMEGPYAAYLLTLSLHHPFGGFPPHLKELDVGRWEGTPYGDFLHTMHFFDASLAAFGAELEAAGLADETVIAVWGDHDAGFSWRPEIAAAMGVRFDPAGWYLSQEVPLLIRAPGLGSLAGRQEVAAGHTDVAPTLLALLGIDPAPYAYVGRNLLGAPGAGPVVGEYGCWRDDRLLFLQGDGSLAGGECIDLETMRPTATARCGDGFATARRIEEVSALVLEHDLQGRIHVELAAR